MSMKKEFKDRVKKQINVEIVEYMKTKRNVLMFELSDKYEITKVLRYFASSKVNYEISRNTIFHVKLN